MPRIKRIAVVVVVVVVACLSVPQPAAAQVQARDNVVIVLDASGSMAERMQGSRASKMDEAKRALVQVLETVPDSTHFGLLIFSSTNLQNDLAYPLGPLDRPKLAQAILSPNPGGGTPLGAYLKRGTDILLQQREAQFGYGSFRLLVVTDGEATDRGLVEAFMPDILSRGITIDVIGVDMQSDHALATRVHSYRRANDPAALRQGLTEILAEIGGPQDDTASADARAVIEPIPDEMAKAMLAALVNSTVGNHPIGEAPPRPGEPGGAEGGSSVPAVAHGPGIPSSPAPEGEGIGATILSVLGFLCGVSVLAMIGLGGLFWVLVKKAQKRGKL